MLASIERDVHTVVLDFEDVPMMDATAMMNLESIVNELSGRSVRVAIVHIHPRLIAKLTRFGLVGPDQPLQIAADVDAVEQAAVASDHSRVG